MRIAIAQMNPTVGNLDGNLEKMLAAAEKAESQDADVIVYPAYALTGAPLAGLASSWAFAQDAQAHLTRFAQACPLLAVVGSEVLLQAEEGDEHISALGLCIVSGGDVDVLNVPAVEEGSNAPVLEIGDATVALLAEGQFPPEAQLESVDLLVELAADTYLDDGALDAAHGSFERQAALATGNGAFVACANLCGAADGTVFSGSSMVVTPSGAVLHVAPLDAEDLFVFDTSKRNIPELPASQSARLQDEEILWRGIVTGTRDYLRKNGFSDVVIGLSGGIDSAVVATVAADAVGAEHVHGLLMPGPYSSEGSLADARALADNLGIGTQEVAIGGPLESLHAALSAACGGAVDGLAAENLQARLRAVYLLTVSNARGWIVLNTGNKSEAAMGFSTLYGDTAGAYAPIGGLYKTDVYRLARWRAGQGPSIPRGSIEKPPSAELYPGATDQDRLPPYEQLDEVLLRHVEFGQGAETLVEAGFDRELVLQVLSAVRKNEFKRRIEPIGPHVSGTSFTEGRAWPITNGWREHSGE